MSGVFALSGFLLLIYYKLTSVHCCMTNGDIMLSSYVQVCVKHIYVPICWEQHTRDVVANTVCKQLGLNGAKSTSSIRTESGVHITREVIHIETCKSDASHIFQCTYNLCKSESCCETKKLLAVTCNSAEYVYEGQLSLVQQYSATQPKIRSNSEGKLRVYLNGKWTFVCNETFGDDEAECSCKQLGYTGHSHYNSSAYKASGSQRMMWIGTNSNEGRLNCSSSETCACLTNCYSKPENTTQCISHGQVYLKCDNNMTTDDQNTAGSESLCTFNKKTPENIIRANVAGIVAGSILFGLICLLGTCVGIYFGIKAKKPCVKPEPSADQESSIKLNYSAVIESNDSTYTDSEQEERSNNYEPPTPLLRNNAN